MMRFYEIDWHKDYCSYTCNNPNEFVDKHYTNKAYLPACLIRNIDRDIPKFFELCLGIPHEHLILYDMKPYFIYDKEDKVFYDIGIESDSLVNEVNSLKYYKVKWSLCLEVSKEKTLLNRILNRYTYIPIYLIDKLNDFNTEIQYVFEEMIGVCNKQIIDVSNRIYVCDEERNMFVGIY